VTILVDNIDSFILDVVSEGQGDGTSSIQGKDNVTEGSACSISAVFINFNALI